MWRERVIIFCINCGKQLKEGAKFCPACGFPVDTPDDGGQSQAGGDQQYNGDSRQQSSADGEPQYGTGNEQQHSANGDQTYDGRGFQPAPGVPSGSSGQGPHKKKNGVLMGGIVAACLVVVIAIAVVIAVVIPGSNNDPKKYANIPGESQTHWDNSKSGDGNGSTAGADNTAPDNAEGSTSPENAGDSTSPENAGGQGTDSVADKVTPLSRPTLVGHSSSTDTSVTPSVGSYTVDPDLGNVYNRDQFYIEPDSEQARLLSENLFYVRAGYSKEFYEVYETNRYSLAPNFVTVDSMMHTYHLYFSYLMKQTERDHIAETLLNLSQTMLNQSMAQYEALKGSEWENAALRNATFFAVGASLQNPDISIDSQLSAVVASELEKIMSASQINECALTGTMIDYSQFTPRGYYEGDAALENYFRAMMWYGQIGFVQKDEDLDRSALLMTLAMNGEALSQWEAIYTVTSFFAGASDDLSYYEYLPAIAAAYGSTPEVSVLVGDTVGWEKFRALTAAMAPPAINSIPTMDDNDASTKSTDENKGFRFMGQRFTIDAAIFQQLIYENVQPDSQGNKRLLPDTLDVAAALGSNTAYDILQAQGETEYKNYAENMDALRTNIANAPDSLWTASLYSNWLFTLTPLLEEKGEGYPSFMRSTQWAAKNLESFAGSYTELKHDTVLYAKQVMAEMGGGELPQWDDRGYVEPETKVWSRFAQLAKTTAEGLKSYGLLSEAEETNLQRLGEMAQQFLVMSEKELSNTLLTDEEYELIRNYGGNLEHFWLEAFKDEGENITSGDFPAAIVTDIATDPNGSCLQVGTGNPSTIYVIVPMDGELHICVGAVYSFYQFEQPLSERMTDSQWRQLMGISITDDGTYSYDTAIDQPEWTQSYRYEYSY